MNELKATPGPWELIEVPRGFIVTADERSYDIATVRNVGNHDNKANAALIAAAPELYSALNNLLDALGALSNPHELYGGYGLEDAEIEAIYAAIKKARGE